MGFFGIGKGSGMRREHVAQAVPGTNIQYDPALIGRLTGEHKELLSLYDQVAKAVAANHIAKVPSLLGEFKVSLMEHLLQENVKLYAYLKTNLATNEQNSEIINEFQHEMGKIGRTVMGFLRTYTETPLTPENLDEFKKQFEAIGAALVSRIQREEQTLYTLYMPPLG